MAKLAIFYPDPILVPVLLPFSYVSLLVACSILHFLLRFLFFRRMNIYIFYHSQSRCSAFSDVKLLRAVATRLHPLWLFLYSVITVGIFFAYCVYLRFRLSFFRSALHYFAFLAFLCVFVCICVCFILTSLQQHNKFKLNWLQFFISFPTICRETFGQAGNSFNE